MGAVGGVWVATVPKGGVEYRPAGFGANGSDMGRYAITDVIREDVVVMVREGQVECSREKSNGRVRLKSFMVLGDSNWQWSVCRRAMRGAVKGMTIGVPSAGDDVALNKTDV